MKILILVLSATSEKYQRLENAIRSTWASIKRENIDVYFYRGDSIKNEIIDDVIHCSTKESYENIGLKTLIAFEQIKEIKFDYLLRTNSSSYIIQDNLISFLSDKPKHNFYCGKIGNFQNVVEYCSGCGYILSRDLFDLIVENKHLWNHFFIDDVAIGDLIVNKMKISICEGAKRLDVHDMNRQYNLDDLQQNYHIRCAWHADRNVDIQHMNAIHQMLKLIQK